MDCIIILIYIIIWLIFATTLYDFILFKYFCKNKWLIVNKQSLVRNYTTRRREHKGNKPPKKIYYMAEKQPIKWQQQWY
jgi:hypothetical protein